MTRTAPVTAGWVWTGSAQELSADQRYCTHCGKPLKLGIVWLETDFAASAVRSPYKVAHDKAIAAHNPPGSPCYCMYDD